MVCAVDNFLFGILRMVVVDCVVFEFGRENKQSGRHNCKFIKMLENSRFQCSRECEKFYKWRRGQTFAVVAYLPILNTQYWMRNKTSRRSSWK